VIGKEAVATEAIAESISDSRVQGGRAMEPKRSLIHEDPRVPLAAERTFLAWIRTGLALMGFGFVVARFGLFLREWLAAQNVEHHSGHGVSLWLGISLVGLGVFLNLAALARYRRYLRQLAQGILPEAKPRLETAVAVTLALIGAAAVLYLILAAC